MRTIFLDRDGVIIRKAPEGEYVSDWSEVEFLPGSLEAIVAFCRSGYKVVIVTNQRGIATGKIQLANLNEIHCRLRQAVTQRGGHISAIYYCPHDIPERCGCRKPKAGMLLQAAAEHHLRLSDCWMVGDVASDIEAGKSAGCRTAFISESTDNNEWFEKPDIWAESLASVAKIILSTPME